MSVLEYDHKFNELSRFALKLVTTEEDKCTRFEEGLRLDIQAVVTVITYPTMKTLAQAVDRVTKKYSLGACIDRRRRDSSGFDGPSQGRGSSLGNGRFGSPPVWSQHLGQQSMTSTTRDPSRRTSSTCHNCGHEGHMRRDCLRRGQASAPNHRSGVTYFYCGQTMHYKSECPHLINDGSTRQETGAHQGQGSRGQGQTQSGASSFAASPVSLVS
ncbi:unnamed protein product [Prunus armeniaca]